MTTLADLASPPDDSDTEPDPDYNPEAAPSDAEIDDDDDEVDKDEVRARAGHTTLHSLFGFVSKFSVVVICRSHIQTLRHTHTHTHINRARTLPAHCPICCMFTSYKYTHTHTHTHKFTVLWVLLATFTHTGGRRRCQRGG